MVTDPAANTAAADDAAKRQAAMDAAFQARQDAVFGARQHGGDTPAYADQAGYQGNRFEFGQNATVVDPVTGQQTQTNRVFGTDPAALAEWRKKGMTGLPTGANLLYSQQGQSAPDSQYGFSPTQMIWGDRQMPGVNAAAGAANVGAALSGAPGAMAPPPPGPGVPGAMPTGGPQMRGDVPGAMPGGPVPYDPNSPLGRSQGMPGLDPAAAPGASMSVMRPGIQTLLGPGGTDVAGSATSYGPNGAVGLGNLGALLERRLGNPTAFGGREIEALRSAMDAGDDQWLNQRFGELDVDAARRGVFSSTIPTRGRGEALGQVGAARKMANAQLLAQAAMARDQGLSGAVQDAMGFLDRAGMEQERGIAGLGNLGQAMLALGLQGGPDMNMAGSGISGFQPSGATGGGMDDLGAVLSMFLSGAGTGGGAGASGERRQRPGAARQLPSTLGLPPGSEVA